MKIKKGDNVKILIGKDKGKTGKVEKVYPARGKVLVAGVNEFKRHLKSRTQNQKSEIVTINKPVPVGNVAIFCGKCKKSARISFKIEKGARGEANKKTRICSNCHAVI